MKKNLTRIEKQLLLECNAMAKYAFSSGLKVSGEIVKVLELYSVKAEDDVTENSPSDSENSKADVTDIRQLSLVHGQLSDIIAPAKPSAILLLETDESGFWKFLGPIPFIRHMLGIAIICLISAILLCMSEDVDGNPEHFNLFRNEGIPLLLNMLFLIASAGIGASFSALFTANRYITDRTFDPVFETTYWSRFVLGLMAGLMLAIIDPLKDKNVSGFGPPMLALLGGFSAVVVYRILNRMTTTLESMIQGDAKDTVAVREGAVKTRLEEKSSKERMQLSGMLTKFQSKLYSGASSKELQQEVERIQESLSTPGSHILSAVSQQQSISQDEQDAQPAQDIQETPKIQDVQETPKAKDVQDAPKAQVTQEGQK